MRKLIISLLLVLFLLPLGAAEGGSMSRMFDSAGNEIPVSSEIDEGCTILTSDDVVTIESEIGVVVLYENSVLTLTSLNPVEIYLITGSVELSLNEGTQLNLYTPITLTAIENGGEFKIISTDEEESIYNNSAYSIKVLDGLTLKTFIVKSGRFINLAAGVVELPSAPIMTETKTFIRNDAPSAPEIVGVMSYELIGEPTAPKFLGAAVYEGTAMPDAPDITDLRIAIDSPFAPAFRKPVLYSVTEME